MCSASAWFLPSIQTFMSSQMAVAIFFDPGLWHSVWNLSYSAFVISNFFQNSELTMMTLVDVC
eukprot:TRINITY_DN73568_c0_g1_i1.p1 TRINITY_DN73568_c0_g1~~TRINITY_DN73568_c0_g1_i1.p1  ORF type:complete len:63 (+),score=2.51 TRINITY_DN73568_c0_g1_i1:38-226(+)